MSMVSLPVGNLATCSRVETWDGSGGPGVHDDEDGDGDD